MKGPAQDHHQDSGKRPLLQPQKIGNVTLPNRMMVLRPCDLAGVGRSLLADPEWVHKVSKGETFQSCSPEAIGTLY